METIVQNAPEKMNMVAPEDNITHQFYNRTRDFMEFLALRTPSKEEITRNWEKWSRCALWV